MRLFLIALILCPSFLWAQDIALPEGARKRILNNPEAWGRQMLRLVAGFGHEKGLDQAGLAQYVALERAGARAGLWQRFLSADLDGDGAVAQAEMQAYAGLLSAGERGGFMVAYTKADQDADFNLSGTELADAAKQAGLARISPNRAETLAAVFALDQDGDGAVTLLELEKGVAALKKMPQQK